MKSIFITGTGTGVGKTFVTGHLLRAFRELGVNACTMKPVQTGAIVDGALWRAPDLEDHWRIASWAALDDERPLMSPCCYALAASPHLAARLEKRPVDLPHILDCHEKLGSLYDLTLIEGAGGPLVPLSDTTTQRELMIDFNAPVVLVADLALGAINHTLAMLEVLEHSELTTLGIIFSETRPTEIEMIAEDNPNIVHALSNVPVLAVVRHGTIPNFRDVAMRLLTL